MTSCFMTINLFFEVCHVSYSRNWTKHGDQTWCVRSKPNQQQQLNKETKGPPSNAGGPTWPVCRERVASQSWAFQLWPGGHTPRCQPSSLMRWQLGDPRLRRPLYPSQGHRDFWQSSTVVWSCLKLNVSKCEIFPLHECDDTFIKKISQWDILLNTSYT